LKSGLYPNYRKTGGTASFADYYTARYDIAIIHNSLKKNVLFCVHNLVTDSAFGEIDRIVYRNVLIYFSRELRNRVFGLFKAGGFLKQPPFSRPSSFPSALALALDSPSKFLSYMPIGYANHPYLSV
jgi:hypothetical protein